jgi:hypothetical protein
MVTRASAVTISRAAEFLSKDQRTIAFALAEMEYLWELLAEHKRNIPAVLSGWLRCVLRPPPLSAGDRGFHDRPRDPDRQ